MNRKHQKGFINHLKAIQWLTKKGYFIFSHRIDLWKKQNFDKILLGISKDFKTHFISRPLLYLPLNKDFKNKIKIRLVLLQKY